jgi:hypothetical protein
LNQKSLPDAIPALFPTGSDRERIGSWLQLELEQASRRVQAGPVTPTLDMQKFRAELEGFDFNEPKPLEDALRWTIERMEHGIVQMANPRYFGLFNPARIFPLSARIVLPAASTRSWPVPPLLPCPWRWKAT